MTPAQEVIESFDPPHSLRQAYTRCAEAPKQERSVECEEYVSFFEQCASRRNECGPRTVYEAMTKLIIFAAPKKPKAEKLPPPALVHNLDVGCVHPLALELR
jgi:hypothetical protein